MSRQFNVYSDQVVLAPNETFEWVVTAREISTGNSVTISSDDWPLPAASYTVEPNKPVTVTVSGSANDTGTFTCSPDDGNVTTHNIIVASQPFIPVCTSVTANPGEYFIWQNPNTSVVSIISDPLDVKYWPLTTQRHDIGPNGGTTAVQIPEDAEDYLTGYMLKVTMGGNSVCPEATQPRLIIGDGK